MFTGIVRTVGHVVSALPSGEELRLTVDTGGLSTDDWRVGDSVCVAGVCLTAERVGAGRFEACVSRATLQRTTLGGLAAGAAVNLEPALAAGGALGGHFVTGHVDGVATVCSAQPDGASLALSVEPPVALARYLAPRGSVTLDGVSLTIATVEGGRFAVHLVPHTRAVTTLGALAPGARLNLEVDILARYLERLFEAQCPR